jgi:hypothetical protein
MNAGFFFFFLLRVLLGVFAWAARRRAEFEERFPPLSDAEFVALCAPGIDPFVALRVRQVLAECLGVEYERIYPSSRLQEDLGAE